MKLDQVIVVEGTHDEQKIKSIYPEIDCIVTNGSEISKDVLNLIYETSKVRDVILFLDPDFPGKQITNKILSTTGNYKIAFLNRNQAKNKTNTKIGIEHANKADIIRALSEYVNINYQKQGLSLKDLYLRKLTNHPNSASLRSYLCDELKIPYQNGKALLKYLNMLNIKIEKVDEILYGE